MRVQRPRRPSGSLARDESGQGVVEFALILPILLLVLVGILEFGSTYSGIISLRQGVREAGRQGSVGQFGPDPATCTLTGTGLANTTTMYRLMCSVKDAAGVQEDTRVKVKFLDKTTLVGGSTFVAGNSLLICAIHPLSSLTGLLQPVLNGRYVKTKSAFRIENADPTKTYTAAEETAPSGQNWNWCV